jgi:hypothetical protein
LAGLAGAPSGMGSSLLIGGEDRRGVRQFWTEG